MAKTSADKITEYMSSNPIADMGDNVSSEAITRYMSGDASAPTNIGGQVLSGLGKTFDFLDTDLNAVTNALRPLVTAINPSLNEVYNKAVVKRGMPNVVPSDLIEAALPGKGGPAAWGKAGLGFLLDVGLSPSTYIAGIGVATKAGTIAAKLKSIGTAAKVDSALVKDAIKAGIVSAPTKKAIKEGIALLPESIAEKAARGHQALITFGIPWGPEFARIRGAAVLGRLETIGKHVKASQFGKAFRKIFIPLTGNKAMDQLTIEAMSKEHQFKIDWREKPVLEVGKLIQEEARKLNLTEKEAQEFTSILWELKNKEDSLKHMLLKAPGTAQKLSQLMIKSDADIETVFHSLAPALETMHMSEKAQFQKKFYEALRDWSNGYNVYIAGLRSLPEKHIDAVMNLFTRHVGIRFLQDVRINTKKGLLQGPPTSGVGRDFIFTKFGEVYKAYLKGGEFKIPLTPEEILTAKGEAKLRKWNTPVGAAKNILQLDSIGKKKFVTMKFGPGEDAAIAALWGPKEYKRVKGLDEAWKANVKELDLRTKGIALPDRDPRYQYSELEYMRSAVRNLMADIDKSWAANYVMYQVNPKFLQKTNPVLFKILKEIDDDPIHSISILQKEFSIPEKLARQYPILLKGAEQSRRAMAQLLDMEHSSGLDTEEFIGNLHYMPKIPTKEARQWLQDNLGFKNAAREWTANHVSMLRRKTMLIDSRMVEQAHNLGYITTKQRNGLLNPKAGLDVLKKLVDSGSLAEEFAYSKLVKYLGVSEVNALARSGKLKIAPGISFKKFFDDNPAHLINVRGQRAIRAVTGHELFEGSRKLGTWVPYVDGSAAPEGLRYVKGGSLAVPRNVTDATGKVVGQEKIAFPVEIAEHLDKYYDFIQLPKAIHPMLELFDKMQDTWKLWTLAPFPVYHIRNVIGNIWNNMLAGMDVKDSVRFYGMAGAIQKKSAKFVLRSVNGIEYTPEQIVKLAKKYDLINTGQFYGDIEKYFDEEARGLAYYITHNKIIESGLKIGNYVENNAKLGHFMWKLENGYGAADAAMSVKKYLFDYRMLTDTEQQAFKRVAPFYTWTRKNIPLQLEALITHPARLLSVSKIKNVLETDYEGVPDERYLPDWMVQNFPIRVRKNNTTGNHEYFLLGNWLPTAEIDKLFRPEKYFVNMMSPLLKEPIQQITNRDTFTGREIDRGNEYERIVGVNMPTRYAHVLRNIRILSEPTRLTKDIETDWVGGVTNLLVGKMYPLQETKERKSAKYTKQEKKSRLKSALKKANKQGDTEEADRIREVLIKLRSQVR